MNHGHPPVRPHAHTGQIDGATRRNAELGAQRVCAITVRLHIVVQLIIAALDNRRR